MSLVDRASHRRAATLARLDARKQAERGQFFTPEAVARIMADLPRLPQEGVVRVLDPGAGSGMLTAAIVQRITTVNPALQIQVTAVENDDALGPALQQTLEECAERGAQTRFISEDFVTWALECGESFDLVIQNPPYRKLRAKSSSDLALRRAGIAVPNIYAAFMALSARLLAPGGQLVAITPRSWMNGTYYASFRRELLETMALDAIHTFESRSLVFGDMDVLQESIIVSMTTGAPQGDVRLRSSLDHTSEVQERIAHASEVVTGDFVFVPANKSDADAVSWMSNATHTLEDLGLTVSTGRVVDFRCRDLLRHDPDLFGIPMVYPANIVDAKVEHPRDRVTKPQWFVADPTTPHKLLVPAGIYVLVKRFSAKEEKRRIVSAVWSDERPPAFDNKLNYIHEDGHGIDPELARGLSIWLNSSRVDSYFRVFSGHTQVNATDLRQMRFPSRQELHQLAQSQLDTDAAVEHLYAEGREAA